ncbi:MAG: response regulator [Opitutaceae bacterium]|nr:response regulator [Opitutaceae bacterium]
MARQPPDLILLDLMMPGMSGLEVCASLRRDPRTREIPIIVLSAADQSRSMQEALSAGAEDYLSKPIPGAELRAKVRTTMRLNRYHELVNERERLRWLVRQSAEPLVILDAAGSVREANPKARELFNLPDEPGVDFVSRIEGGHRAEPEDAFARLRARDYTFGAEFTIYRPETRFASSLWLRAEWFRDASTPSGDVLLKFSDCSERIRHRLEAWTFQHLLSHKIRTPLNGMTSTLDMLADDPEFAAGPDGREFVLAARESAHRLEDTLLSILRYHETLCARSLPADAAPALSWRELLEQVREATGVPVLRYTGDAEAPVKGPEPRLIGSLRIALTEIFENYLKFSDAKSHGLEAEFCGAGQLRFFSRGRPVPPEFLARLGQPYSQLEKTFSGEVPGMGLGLATVTLLLRAAGADIRFGGRTEPAGLVTEVVLPDQARPEI